MMHIVEKITKGSSCFRALGLGMMLGVALVSCSTHSTQKKETLQIPKVDTYENVLDICFSPSNRYGIEHSLFSDKGAWHAYAAPEQSRYYGGFSGPMVMSMHGEWLSKNFSQWFISENGSRLEWDNAIRSVKYLPGSIEQTYLIDNLEIEQSLIFVNKRTSMVQTIIRNVGDKNRILDLEVDGTLWSSKNHIRKESNNGVVVNIPGHNATLSSLYYPSPNEVVVANIDSSYVMKWHKKELEPNDSLVFNMTQNYRFNDEMQEVQRFDFDKEIVANHGRWNGYLNNYFKKQSALLMEPSYQRVAVKSIMTLVTNYRSAAGDLKHAGTFPSLSYQGFYGFWSWDSWKHAVAYCYFDPEMAKDNLRSMFDYQNERGMVADCIYINSKENNWRDTKPPLASWAVSKIFETTLDTSFVREMLPKLEKYHQWWYADRDHDKNMLCEYGSTDGTRVAAAWESGMDNAVRFDHAKMLKNRDKAWSLDQESVDLNCYLYYDKLKLEELHQLLELGEKQYFHKEETKRLKDTISKYMYNQEKGFFFDIDLKEKHQIEIYGPEGWIALWAEVATKKQAERVVNVVMDTTHFNTYIPFPTLDASHSKFNPLLGYWRGPVWLDQAYFGIKGMRKYGYHQQADYLTRKILDHCEGLKADDPIRENYHPITGEGLNAVGFSWSSAHLLMMLKEK